MEQGENVARLEVSDTGESPFSFLWGFKGAQDNTEGGVGVPLENEWYIRVFDEAGEERKFALQETTEGFLVHSFRHNHTMFFEDGAGELSFITSVVRLIGGLGE